MKIMKKNILVLFGGQSGEHEVSINSAASVIANLDPRQYNVIPLCISKNGQWLAPAVSIKYLKTTPALKQHFLDNLKQSRFDIGKSLTGPRHLNQIDVVFPVLHGPYGEDGTVQGFLELWGVPFVGSDTLASALAMDKIMSKKVFIAEKIPTPAYWVVTANNLRSVISKITLPCVVKPVNLGSSVGVSIVKKKPELRAALELALKLDRKGEVLVEKFVFGREITVPVLDGKALPVIEIVPRRKGDWFNYEVKYSADLVDEICPALISKAATAKAQDLGARAHNALKCRHISRVDMILTKSGSITVLEVNTLPGMTSVSLFPKAAKAMGMSYGQLLDKLVAMAIRDN